MNLYKRHLILLFFIIIRTLPGQFQVLNAQSAVAGVDPSYSSSKNFITTSKSRIRIDRISEDSLSILFTSLLTEKSSPTGSAPPGHSKVIPPFPGKEKSRAGILFPLRSGMQDSTSTDTNSLNSFRSMREKH
jgi:hypothetical protein